MEVAGERACLLLPTGSEKQGSSDIASKILDCATCDTTLSRLTEAGYAAAMQLTAFGRRDHILEKKEVAH
jgi:hypothetical protein